MKIKLLAFDLDGTTLVNHCELSPGNRQALLAAAEQGVMLVPATGRMLYFLPQAIRDLPVQYAITSNGGAVYHLESGQAVIQNLIDNRTARKIQQVLGEYDIYIEYYSNGSAITRRDMPAMAKTHFGLPETKWGFVDGKEYALVDDLADMLRETGLCPEKINLPFLSPSIREELWERLGKLEGLRITSSISDNMEINSLEAHKGGALLALAHRLGFRREELMAIGDNGNDITMLEAAGCSAAVADGSPQALAAAGCLTCAHDQDGVAQAIRRFILKEPG